MIKHFQLHWKIVPPIGQHTMLGEILHFQEHSCLQCFASRLRFALFVEEACHGGTCVSSCCCWFVFRDVCFHVVCVSPFRTVCVLVTPFRHSIPSSHSLLLYFPRISMDVVTSMLTGTLSPSTMTFGASMLTFEWSSCWVDSLNMLAQMEKVQLKANNIVCNSMLTLGLFRCGCTHYLIKIQSWARASTFYHLLIY